LGKLKKEHGKNTKTKVMKRETKVWFINCTVLFSTTHEKTCSTDKLVCLKFHTTENGVEYHNSRLLATMHATVTASFFKTVYVFKRLLNTSCVVPTMIL
jgi:hypothetical protein